MVEPLRIGFRGRTSAAATRSAFRSRFVRPIEGARLPTDKRNIVDWAEDSLMKAAMAALSPFSPQGRFADWRLATQSIIGFWAFYLVTVLLRGLFDPEAASAIGYRGINAALGLGLTFLIYVAIRIFARDAGIRRMAIVAAVAALPAAVLMSFASLRMATWSD